MTDFDVIARIKELCLSRSWSYYRLAKEAGIPYSSLNTMLHKSYSPTIPSLTKICDGFGITLAQFFSEHNECAKLTKEEILLLDKWKTLDSSSRKLAFAYMDGLFDKQEQSN